MIKIYLRKHVNYTFTLCHYGFIRVLKFFILRPVVPLLVNLRLFFVYLEKEMKFKSDTY